MVGTMILPAWMTDWQGGLDRMFDAFSFFAFLWLLSSAPLLISFVLAITLKRTVSTVILLCSTIAYAIWYAYWLHFIFFSDHEFASLAIIFIGIWSLPVMLPAWITALILNWRYVQTSATSSPPALLEEENEVQ